MIYANTDTTNISIPCSTDKVSTEYTLILTNGISHMEYEYTVTDEMVSSLYYYFPITLEIEQGEYDYRLIDVNENTVAIGLLQFGVIQEEPSVIKKYYQRERIIKTYNR